MFTYHKRLFFISVLSLLVSLCFSVQASAASLFHSDDFESGYGGWSNVTNGDNENWTRDSAGTSSSNTGPATGAGGSTYYMYLETSSGQAYESGDVAILEGPSISAANIHFSFKYHMYGSNIGALAVDVLSGGSWVNDVWSISGQQQSSNGSTYTTVDVDLSSYSVSQIRFRATAVGGFMGDIAIDDITISSIVTGPVAPVFNSDPLEKSIATQDQPYSDSIALDATDGNGDSLFFSKISGAAWLNIAQDGVLSGTPDSSDVGMNSFVVEVSDGSLSSTATVNINVNDNTSPILLSSSDFELNQGDWSNVTSGDNKNWSRDSAGTPSSNTGPDSGADGSNYYMYLETSSGQAYESGDTAILQGPNVSGSNINLSFKYHMYGSNIGILSVDVLSGGSWINDVWSISGQQQSSNSAAYTLVDVNLSAYDVFQVRFRATAAGDFRGDIAIDSVELWSIPSGPVKPVFTSDPLVKSDAIQDQAYSDSIALDATDVNGDLLVFSKISGPAWLTVAADGVLSGIPGSSDIGDNSFVVEVSDGELSSTATLNILVNDNTTPIILSSSDFEANFGDWSNATSGDNENWTRDSAGTPSSGTGPATGANGSSYYMFLETSSGYAYESGDTAILIGPSISSSNIHLNFEYHMYGSNIGTLAVDVLSGGSWINDVWSISGQQQTSNSSAYTTVDLDLSSYLVSQIRFRATAIGGYTGDIAIDNVEITSINLNPNDSDNDGVLDGVDQCPNTPNNEVADVNGCSSSQLDSDNDGVLDINDAFPLDSTEWLDTDGDGIGNNADTDDDNDGVIDTNDDFPLDSNETTDTDGDGVGNNADTDDDNDGVDDATDAFPLDAAESLDTDGDGTGNNADIDDDNDGVDDINDDLPLDPTETTDTDGDGVGNNADTDDDNDGVDDVTDAFPLDATESLDTDGDGIGNNADIDDDNDGLTDSDEITIHNSDPLNADTDSDGLNDGIEVTQYQTDPTLADSDLDDLSDADEVRLYGTAPLSNDSDGDGIPDAVEIESSLDPNNSADAESDLDGDGYTNLDEYYSVSDINDSESFPIIKPWAMLQGDAGHTGYLPLTLNATGFTHMWTIDPGVGTINVSITKERMVYVSTQGYYPKNPVIKSLDLQSGDELWRLPLGGASISAPSYDNGMVYIHTGAHGDDSFLWGIDANTGGLIFKGGHRTQHIRYSSPTIYEGNAYMNGAYYRGMLAKSTLDGTTLWTTDETIRDDYWEPAVDEDYVYVPNVGSLTILNRQTGAITAAFPSSSEATPVLTHHGFLLTYSGSSIICTKISNQKILWEATLPSATVEMVAVGRGMVLAVSDDGLTSINELSGNRNWHWSSDESLTDQLAVTATHAFVSSDNATYAIDLNTQQMVWSYPVGGKLSLGDQGVLLIASGSEITVIDILGDTDGDGIPTWWESAVGLDASDSSDANADADADGLTALEEYNNKTNPFDNDSDDDGLLDGDEVSNYQTDPNNQDSDDDGLNDTDEIVVYATNPLVKDSDGDNIPDAFEVENSLDPNNSADAESDLDSDGYSNLDEYYEGTRVDDAQSFPVLKPWTMLQGDAGHTGYLPLILDADEFSHVWTIDPRIGQVNTSIAIDGKIYTTSGQYNPDDPMLKSMDLITGQELWVMPLIDGSISAPSYGNGLVYVHTGGHDDTFLWGVNADTGDLVFKGSHASQWPRYSAPTIFDDSAYINGGDTGGVVAKSVVNGETIWLTKEAKWSDYWEPAVDKDNVYFPYNGDLIIRDRHLGSQVALIENIDASTPVLTNHGMVLTYTGSTVTCSYISQQKTSWVAGTPGATVEMVAVVRGMVLAVSDDGLTSINELTGDRNWHWSSDELLTDQLAVTATHAFVSSETTTYAIDLNSQQMVWSYPVGGKLSLGDQGVLLIASGSEITVIDILGDGDGDGIPTWWERSVGLNPNNPLDASLDVDNDGLTALEEYNNRTDPFDNDSDNDGLLDGDEVVDYRTDPNSQDSDDDGLNDADEVEVYATNPLSKDTDGDNIPDVFEVQNSLDPNNSVDAEYDLDGDSYTNLDEYFEGTNILDAQSFPILKPWAMFQGDAGHTGYLPLILDDEQFNHKWTLDPSIGDVNALIANDGKIFITSGGYRPVDPVLKSLDLQTGEEQWVLPLSGASISAPSYGNGMVYVHSGGSSDTFLWGIDATTGQLIFKGDHWAQWPTYSAPTIYGDTSYMNGGQYGGMLAKSALDGTTLWDTDEAIWEDYWEPAVDENYVYVPYEGDLTIRDRQTGSLVTSIKDLDATTPVLTNHGEVLTYTGSIITNTKISNQKTVWVASTPGADIEMVAVGRGMVLAVSDNGLTSISKLRGTRNWHWNSDESLTDQLAVTATHAFVSSETTTYAIDLNNQQMVWSYPVGGKLSLSDQGVLLIASGQELTVINLTATD